MEVTKEQFSEWQNSHVTQEVFKALTSVKDEYIEQIRKSVAAGDWEKASESHGLAAGIEQILLIEFEDATND